MQAIRFNGSILMTAHYQPEHTSTLPRKAKVEHTELGTFISNIPQKRMAATLAKLQGYYTHLPSDQFLVSQ